jgi:hypothetical protein
MILLNGQIPLQTHQSGHATGNNNGSGFFHLKCFYAWFKIFHSTFLNRLGDFS